VAGAPTLTAAGASAAITVAAGSGVTATVNEFCVCAPEVPTQPSAYVVVVVGATLEVPLEACAPLQPPEAVQTAVVSVSDQLSTALLPATMVAGVAVRVSSGAPTGLTMRFAVDVAEAPAAFVQVRLKPITNGKVLVVFDCVVTCVPLVASVAELNKKTGVAVQLVALVLDHMMVELPPEGIVEGLTVMVAVGPAALTVTVAAAGVAVVPPAPVHASE
jgi:hypothetical protein